MILAGRRLLGATVCLFGFSPCLAQQTGVWVESHDMSRWQTSGLTVRHHRGKVELWSHGDQNSRQFSGEPAYGGGYLYCFDGQSGRLIRPVLRIQYSRGLFFGPENFTRNNVLRETIRGSRFTSKHEYEAFDSSDAVDYEGLVFDPKNSNRLFAVTEGHAPWLIQIDLNEDSKPMKVSKAVRVTTTDVSKGDRDYSSGKMKENERWEGITIDSLGKRFYLACERHDRDPRPRIFALDRQEFETPQKNRNGFLRLSPKPALSDEWEHRFKEKYGVFPCISGLTCISSQTQAAHPGFLVALERNKVKLVVIDLASRRVIRFVDLELRAPDRSGNEGLEVHWISPEGIASDAKGNIWLINDPVFRRKGERYWPVSADESEFDGAKFQKEIPLIFRVKESIATATR